MYCSNCGAEISEKDAYCPYCGVMNARAAEREYMEKLEDIREDTERLGEESGKESRRGMTIAGKKALKIFVIVAVIILGLTSFFIYLETGFLRGDAKTARAEAAFKEKYFPKLDEYYAAGDDDATAAYLQEIGNQDGAAVLSGWKHYMYMKYYMDYANVCGVRNRELDDDFWKYEYELVLYDGIQLIYETDIVGYQGMTSAEKEKVRGYQKEAEEILEEYFSLSRSDLDEIHESSVDEGNYLYRSQIREWAAKTGGENK